MAIDTVTLPRTNAESWLDLERERRKSIVSTQEFLRQHILERWATEGLTSEKVDGYTVHLRRGLYPKPADAAALADALREEGLTDLLTVDTKAMGIWIAAHEDAGTALPERIADLVGEPFERFSLTVKLR
jgi:hypothetical protein